MVGALADWFAVTALFRHPLGIPIPHTAIIPTRKDQIGESLGEFVQTNFLTRRGARRTARRGPTPDGASATGWPAGRTRARAGGAVADALRGTLQVIDDRDVSHGLERLVARTGAAVPVAPLVSRAITLAMEGGHQERLLDSVLRRGSAASSTTPPVAARAAAAREPVVGARADRQPDLRQDLRRRADVPARRRTTTRTTRCAPRSTSVWPRSPSGCATTRSCSTAGEELKDEVLAHPEVRAWIGRLWGDLKRTTLHATTAPRQRAAPADRRLAGRARPAGCRPIRSCRPRSTSWLVGTVGYLVDHYRGEVAELISTHRGEVGRPGDEPPRRAAGRARPAVHPDQRHARRRPRRHPRYRDWPRHRVAAQLVGTWTTTSFCSVILWIAAAGPSRVFPLSLVPP